MSVNLFDNLLKSYVPYNKLKHFTKICHSVFVK